MKLLSLSRNFGKEVATTAGIHRAQGAAILTIDADGQHPVDRIPAFVERWQHGARVVIGRRTNRSSSVMKRSSSKLFYKLFRTITGMPIEADVSDFRLIDREVQREFNKLTEHNRITRGLIDWIGFKREYVSYAEQSRLGGSATYTYR